jgi:hypothetical protein
VYWLIVCFFFLDAFTLGLYTQLDFYLFTTLQTDFHLFTTRLLDYKDYLANFIYMNSSLISICTLTWLGIQSWTLSWLNFFLNSVFKLNRIIWSFSWLRLLDLNQLKLLIFILLSLDLHRVLYIGILLGSDSFRSLPSPQIDPFYLIRIQLYLLVESVLYKLVVPVYKKVSYPKQRSLLVLHVFILPDLLTRVFTRLVNSLLISYLDFYPRLCPISYPSRFPNLYRVATWVIPEHVTRSFTRVLPGHVPNRVNPTLPERLPGQVKSYPIAYLSLPEAYPTR